MTGLKKPNTTPTVIKKPKTSIEICPFLKNPFTRQNNDNMKLKYFLPDSLKSLKKRNELTERISKVQISIP